VRAARDEAQADYELVRSMLSAEKTERSVAVDAAAAALSDAHAATLSRLLKIEDDDLEARCRVLKQEVASLQRETTERIGVRNPRVGAVVCEAGRWPHSDGKVATRNVRDFGWEIVSRGRFGVLR
jgi:hypothetical protein